ncbi:WhiB family transcriptional regulator [Haloactinomyces albus]|uniref:WhiB family redox-sensing transcriptional regulator n=1 Tax=Haloactinomyces albus TaxID=1352928 RepID=A0AAE4CNA4_9ACTN|nr:WhiB family transcriptional regulator [Haloactinomyces albus]MDR7301827.1 WhiB family redox-sensing transcriptional regulator [Haloactinomyces albus]MDR7304732.1 WhiB family redox-sensing transcriptional regulator [Haloactinomyces albus]
MSTAAQPLNCENTLSHLITRLPSEHFAQQPACANSEVDPELFFPVGPGAARQIAAAKQVCESCPVRQACLSFALHHDVHGVWGGSTRTERAALRRTGKHGEAAA